MQFRTPTQSTIVAKYDDPKDGFALIINLTHEKGIDLLAAVRNAVRNYAITDDDWQDAIVQSGDFNWGDFVNEVPNTICQQHGFQIDSTYVSHLIVDHDETLLPTDDPSGSDTPEHKLTRSISPSRERGLPFSPSERERFKLDAITPEAAI